ncbi:MAG: monovalent cation:proton antiporter-2 (CPA2) family protein, partial [Verrucomicrobiota bacterium]
MAFESLFQATVVYLATAVIAVTAAKLIGVSSVLGFLVGGILIGPFCLKLVGDEGADVMHFSEFGVVLMLFLVGLELKPKLLWQLRGPILGLGGGQVGVTLLVIAGITMACGFSWQVSLAVGMALALSSTAIVLQTLQEKNLSQTTAGQSAFSVLLFQDIAVIPMLAIFPLLATISPDVHSHDGHHEEAQSAFQLWLSHQPAWVNTLLVFAVVAGIILGGRYLFQPIFSLVARTRVRETFVALALLLVIGIALLMSQLGVSPALGTFIAGVVLAESEYRHELEADIEPFKGLLLGVFFISVGAGIDFSLIAQKPFLVLGLMAALLITKAIILFILAKFGRLSLSQSTFFALALAQGGEFAFVLLGFGLSEGVLDAALVQILIAVVAISMALTPVILLVEERVLRPRLVKDSEGDEQAADEIEEDADVILVGFGRFGNYVGRFLLSQKIPL